MSHHPRLIGRVRGGELALLHRRFGSHCTVIVLVLASALRGRATIIVRGRVSLCSSASVIGVRDRRVILVRCGLTLNAGRGVAGGILHDRDVAFGAGSISDRILGERCGRGKAEGQGRGGGQKGKFRSHWALLHRSGFLGGSPEQPRLDARSFRLWEPWGNVSERGGF